MSRRRLLRTTTLLGGVVAMLAPLSPVAAVSGNGETHLLVQPATTADAVLEDVARLGGELVEAHDAVGLLHVRLPLDAVASLEADSDVAGTAPAAAVTFASDDWDDEDSTDDEWSEDEASSDDEGSSDDEQAEKDQEKAAKDAPEATSGTPVSLVAETVGADEFHDKGLTGAGIDIALIDTGVAALPGLAGRVENALDLSFDSGNPAYAGTDGHGHGTHLAGIMVAQADGLTGIAPGARVIDVRVGDRHGVADVSQVIAAIDWTIQNAHTGGRNIRVINLAFGTPSTQHWSIDPLAHAVEAAWRNGIVVVSSVGNDGAAVRGVSNPAQHPLVLAIGATDTQGTASAKDDRMASFSQHGTRQRGPDVVAPGASLLSLVPADSHVARTYPEAARGALFVGSGTSQAAAVTSASVALLLQAWPSLTPDEVKAALRGTAMDLLDGDAVDGAGRMNVGKTRKNAGGAWGAVQSVRSGDGSGSLEASRGGRNLELVDQDGNVFVLEGERNFDGTAWRGTAWGGSNWQGSNWQGSNWQGSNWQGSNWQGSNWQGSNWQGSNWQGSNWQGSNWYGSNWG